MLRLSHLSFMTLACITFNVQAQDLEALKLDTRKQALPVLPKVVAMMKETVVAKGAVDAIPVCKDKAPMLLKEQADKTGWQMRRVSLKTRNAERGTPDVWEARQLADFDLRAAAGGKPETLYQRTYAMLARRGFGAGVCSSALRVAREKVDAERGGDA